MKRLISSFAALVAVACLVSACGQKGPLYLPEDGKNGKAERNDSHQHSHQHAPAEEPEQSQEQTEPSPAQ